MKFSDIALHRMQVQHIGGERFTSVTELVQHLGAMQAQDYAAVKWALGVRLPLCDLQDIETAFSEGSIIRTHVLRPTWHIAAAEDIHWMLMLTAPKIRSSMRARHKELELDEAILRKANRILEKALAGGKHLSREALLQPLIKAGIRVNENRSSHILLSAELDGLIGSGATINGKYTYALLDHQVKHRKHLSKEEALAELARRYFTSHGPATFEDFCWWSGLPAGDARTALESVKSKLENVTIGGKPFWFHPIISRVAANTFHLLPAYDEFLISYTDRTPSLLQAHHARVISSNGIFRPVIIDKGKVAGLWKWPGAKSPEIQADWFNPATPVQVKKFRAASQYLTRFRQKE